MAERIKISIFCHRNVCPEMTHISAIYLTLIRCLSLLLWHYSSSPSLKRAISGHLFYDGKCFFRLPLPPLKFPMYFLILYHLRWGEYGLTISAKCVSVRHTNFVVIKIWHKMVCDLISDYNAWHVKLLCCVFYYFLCLGIYK